MVQLLEVIEKDGRLSDQRAEASDLLDFIQCYEFVFLLHLMKTVLGITNELSQALQRKDQDLVNAMDLVKSCKRRFQHTRDNGWQSLLEEICVFCEKNSVSIPNMEDVFVARGRSRRGVQEFTNLHHFQNDLFYTIIDDQMGELNSRFNEVNTELLLCMACLNPSDSFSAFDKKKLIQFAEFYPSDFSALQLLLLDNQLENYIMDVRDHPDFSELKSISDLSQRMIETKKAVVYPLVYYLLKLSLILPVATATVERSFSAMKIIKSTLRNRMGDEWMNDCLVTYVEREMFETISTENIIKQFQKMKSRRICL